MAEADKLVIIGAGGTGGHMFPARAFADEMIVRGWRVGLISDDRGLRYADTFPAEFKIEVKASSPNLKKPWTLPGTALKIRKGIGQAKAVMREQRPALAAGFGGYPAFPVLSAAKALKVPIIVHEQNAVLGRVNRQFAKVAKVVASGFERLDRLPPGSAHIPLGNPVRAPILAVRDAPYPSTDENLTILITGGSQGAKILGDILPLAIVNHINAPLLARLKVVQQVREEQLEQVRMIYDKAMVNHELAPFFKDMPERLRDAHLIIARSGAGAVSEIAAVGRPSILIPLAIAMDDHQTANAEALTAVGAADVILEANMYPSLIGELLNVRLGDAGGLRARAAAAKDAGKMSAAKELADIAVDVAAH